MFRAIRMVVATMVILVVFATTLAPALADIFAELQAAFPNSELTQTVIGNTTTVLFIGMPLLLLGGVILVMFLVAFGRRGTSF